MKHLWCIALLALGCAGKADSAQDACTPNEMQADGANGFGWIHWDSADSSIAFRSTQCFYMEANGSQWSGGSSTSVAEPILCWMSNGAAQARLQVSEGALLFVPDQGTPATLGTCR